jgi:hypothetical protein
MISEVLPFCLYLSAGLITGFHVYALLSSVVYGIPIDPLEIVSLLGSFCLVIAAYVTLFKPRAAAKVALLACLAIWCFYGPAIAHTVRTKLIKPSSVSTFSFSSAPLEGACRRLTRQSL